MLASKISESFKIYNSEFIWDDIFLAATKQL